MATNVLHRTTMAFVPGVPDGELDQYPKDDYIHDPDLAPIEGVPHALWVLEGEKLRPMNPDELAARDEAIALATKKAASKGAVDAKSAALIAGGFIHAGKQFSLSTNAQMNITNLFANRARQPYPVPYMTKDDTEVHLLVDEAEVEAFYDAAYARVREVLAAGAGLKEQVATAATMDEIPGIKDGRK